MAMNDDDFGIIQWIGLIFGIAFFVSLCIADFGIFVIFASLIASVVFWCIYLRIYKDSFIAKQIEEDSGCNFGYFIMFVLTLLFLGGVLFIIGYFDICLW